jgi:ubiquinone/menaquinone biosynthesis C-methylase UbiE
MMIVFLLLSLLLLLSTNYGYQTVKYINLRFQKVSTQKFSTKIEKIYSPSEETLNFQLKIADTIIASPFFKPVISIAKNTMISTAESCGINWREKSSMLLKQTNWKTIVESVKLENDFKIPEYFINKFHGYEDGNLCIEAAIEQDIAGKAVGARNYPNDGILGEEVFRQKYDDAITSLGGSLLPNDAIAVDFGCGAGRSTRRLAAYFPNIKSIVGIDMSPYMISVARFMKDEFSKSNQTWVENILPDPRISYEYNNIETTKFADNSVSLVSICLVLHELPQKATIEILTEAHRILEKGGKLIIMEMDPSSPGFKKLRANGVLFSVLKSTEPFLGEYFDLAPKLPQILEEVGFPVVSLTAATGRHLAILAQKKGKVDYRPSDEKRLKMDDHMNTWNSNVKNKK